MSGPGDRSIPGAPAGPGAAGRNNWRFMTGCLVIIGVIVLGFVGCTVAVTHAGNSSPSTPNNSVAATQACEKSIKSRLKSPSTAEFEDDVSGTGAGPYTVTGTVDSQNSFGAMLRSSFQCTVSASTTSVDYLE